MSHEEQTTIKQIETCTKTKTCSARKTLICMSSMPSCGVMAIQVWWQNSVADHLLCAHRILSLVI